MYFIDIKLIVLVLVYVTNVNACHCTDSEDEPKKPQKPQNWPYLKLPFAMKPENGFKGQPRTIEAAKIAGWTKVDDSGDCKDVNGGK